MSSFVVHYGEIGTKGANRNTFERQMETNLRSRLAGLGGAVHIEKVDQRFIVTVGDDVPVANVGRILRETFGTAWSAQARIVDLGYDSIKAAAVDLLRAHIAKASTFRVTARRPNKSFELSSQQMAAKLGDDLRSQTGLRVDLTAPDVTIFVDVLSDRAVLYTERVKGVGGLPVGITGKVVHLLSGGIDSPVAAWLMMKRGCEIVYLHFYVAPRDSDLLETKIVSLLKILSTFGGSSTTMLVPFVPYQLGTVGLPSDHEPIAFRHFMRLVAEELAARIGALAVSTGDNLGQVASQTLQNLGCIDAGAVLPVLRPLLTYDKSEIVDLAKDIGTFDRSIEDYKDCCSIVSRHPLTRMRRAAVIEDARVYGFANLVRDCLSQSSVLRCDMAKGTISLGPLESSSSIDGRQQLMPLGGNDAEVAH